MFFISILFTKTLRSNNCTKHFNENQMVSSHSSDFFPHIDGFGLTKTGNHAFSQYSNFTFLFTEG